MYDVRMRGLHFEWDEAKNRLNKRKHKVSFQEAATIFLDEYANRYHDPDHSTEDEDRFLMLGISSKLRVLIVCHCYMASDCGIRIISARKADKKETLDYWNKRS